MTVSEAMMMTGIALFIMGTIGEINKPKTPPTPIPVEFVPTEIEADLIALGKKHKFQYYSFTGVNLETGQAFTLNYTPHYGKEK